jgi:hypothetical protein
VRAWACFVPYSGRGIVVEWPWNGRGATHCDKVGAAAPEVLALVLVVAVSMCGARFVGGVVGAAGDVVSALTL